MLNLKKFVKENALVIIGVIVGATGGYLYYHYVGCASGSCAITSKPINSTVYGAIMGGLLLSMLKKEPVKTTKEKKAEKKLKEEQTKNGYQQRK